jgi:hypothetical protein
MPRMDRRIGTCGATPVAAGVEWRSERRWAEYPLALVVAGERVEVVVEERWVDGPASAGGETYRGFIVADRQGRSFRVRHGSGGVTTVELLLEAPGGGAGYDDPTEGPAR